MFLKRHVQVSFELSRDWFKKFLSVLWPRHRIFLGLAPLGTEHLLRWMWFKGFVMKTSVLVARSGSSGGKPSWGMRMRLSVMALESPTCYLLFVLRWLNRPFGSLNKDKRHIFHSHQELYWTRCSPFWSSTFCHF